jgi:hypothetical protein
VEQSGFWEIIERLRAENQNDIDRMRRGLVRVLAEMTDPELESFASAWSAAAHRADRRSLVEAITVAFGGCSDDLLTDVCDWLICQGEYTYEQILGDPDCLLEFLGPQGLEAVSDAEMFHQVIWDALETNPLPRKDWEPPPEDEGIDLSDRAAVFARYPKLASYRHTYLTTPLPAVPVTLRATPARTLLLGSAWTGHRRGNTAGPQLPRKD